MELSVKSNSCGWSQNGGMQEMHEFKQFDVVVFGRSDHHYKFHDHDGGEKQCFMNSNSRVHKQIMKEWRILANHLPDNIYVRVYGTRIDLMRAVIVGAPGTPYHDGLFFFDIKFPHNYPTRPPLIIYRGPSFGLQTISPNFYSDGTICLSLLNNTLTGQRWDSYNSTILQLLVSLQGLVLCEKPYFFDQTPCPMAEKYSRFYNEEVFVAVCKTTLLLLQNPPKYFEAFIACHFRQRASVILEACIAYANGRVLVGYYDNTSPGSTDQSAHQVRSDFRESVDKLYQQLVVAFRTNRRSLRSKEESNNWMGLASSTN